MQDIAFLKKVHSSINKASAANVCDGNDNTFFVGDFFPASIDIDLDGTYELSKIELFIPENKALLFSLYASDNGKDYKRFYRFRDKNAFANGVFSVELRETVRCSILRVYLEYSNEDKVYLSNVRVYGEHIGASHLSRNESFEKMLGIKPFCETEYSCEITPEETIENVYGIVDRTVGKQYREWFSFALSGENAEYDCFEITDKDGKIHIKGNIGLALTMGLNYYYKHYLNVNVSEQTIQGKMPDAVIPVGSPQKVKVRSKIRYAFNYCTLCYTFAFFDEAAWQRENDWLALCGVNLVMDLAGIEATWIKFLMHYGYSFDDAKDFLTGPAYSAWQFMGNMESFGGALHDAYLIDRVELARRSRRFRRSLGMQSMLQGYAGMVPTDFPMHSKAAPVIPQGIWNGFSRPNMIATDTAAYAEMAKCFYESQAYVYGTDDNYYAVDPFHEGGIRPEALKDDAIAECVLWSLLAHDKNAVWVVQGWQSNPTSDLLRGMGSYKKSHVLILDLIKYPIESNTKFDQVQYGETVLDSAEFCGASWVFGLLGGFGGNPTMNGQLQVMTDRILSAFSTSKKMCGLGILSEGQFDNPIVYDLIFDLSLDIEGFNLDRWIEDYTVRRYGAESENAKVAWDIMKKSNYNHGVRFTKEVYGTRYGTPYTHPKQTISYGPENLLEALRLLLKDYEILKASDGYLYDLTEIMRQAVSNGSVLIHNALSDAIALGDKAKFLHYKKMLLDSLGLLNTVAGTGKDQLAGEWIGKAYDLGKKYDDFTVDSFVMNAKTLITTWGSRASCRYLRDYGWRNYEGMFTDLNYAIWKEYLDRVEENFDALSTMSARNKSYYFELFWDFVLADQAYTREPNHSDSHMKAVAEQVLTLCSSDALFGADAIEDIALNRECALSGGECDGDLQAITRDDTSFVVLHGEGPYVTVNLIGEFSLCKITLDVENECTVKIYFGTDGKAWYSSVQEQKLHAGENLISISNEKAKFAKLLFSNSLPVTVRRIKAFGERILQDAASMERLLSEAERLFANQKGANGVASLLESGKKAVRDKASPDQISSIYWELYEELTKAP